MYHSKYRKVKVSLDHFLFWVFHCYKAIRPLEGSHQDLSVCKKHPSKFILPKN